MSLLNLPKQYGDLQLLFKADIDAMWDELEYFTNGGITADNLNTGWASFSQIELEEDTDFYFGDNFILRFSDDTLKLMYKTTTKDFIFTIDQDEKMRIDNNGSLISKEPIYFSNNSNYPLSTFMNYSKPVLIYTDSTTISLQQNVTVANRTVLIFPAGIVDVTEDISSTHKFRQLKTSATANGYNAAHTGAADSGMRSGLTLAENTWYFVYAAIVRGGDDVGNFVMVVDDRSPVPANWSDLDGTYGAGCWVYLGPLRYGYGEAATTTLIPFIMDNQGWISFVGGAETDNFFGIRLASTIISGTSYETIWQEQIGNEGESIPANFSTVKITYRPVDADDSEMTGQMVLTDSDNNILQLLPSFSVLLDPGEAHGFECKIPTGMGLKLKGRIGA